MPNFKNSRTAEDIKREITAILRDLKDPRIDKMLTVIRADLSGDMSFCKVYVSSFEGLERAKESVKGLKSAEGYIKRELFSRLKLRKAPSLVFIADNSTEISAEISKKLNDLL